MLWAKEVRQELLEQNPHMGKHYQSWNLFENFDRNLSDGI